MGEKVREKRLSNPAYIAVLFLSGLVLIVGAIMYGKSDDGEIDVNNVINTSNQKRVEEGGNPDDNTGTTPNALKDLPNGGLVPQDPNDNQPSPEPIVVEEGAVDETADDAGNNPSEDSEASSGDGGTPAEEVPPEEVPAV